MLLSLCKWAFPFVPNVCIQDRPSFIRRMDSGTLNDTCIRMTSFLVVNFSFGEVYVQLYLAQKPGKAIIFPKRS